VTDERTAVRLERSIPAPPERVYRAWLDPELIARWMAPGTYAVTRAEVDERPGGRYRVWHEDSGLPVGGFECELAELVPGERLVFRWGFAGPEDGGPVFDSVLTVTFRAAPGGTVLTLLHERLDDLAAALPGVAANVGPGWQDVLGKLAGVAPDNAAAVAAAADLREQGAVALLRHGSLARLAYTGTDGFPRVIPVGFYWNGERVIVCTATTAPKVAALAVRPHVALTIDSDDGATRTLSVRGVATMTIVDGIPGEYLAAAAKTMPEEAAREFEAQVRATYDQMVRIAIEPRFARYHDFAAGRLPEFLQQLVSART